MISRTIADMVQEGCKKCKGWLAEDFISLTCLSPSMKCCLFEIYEVSSVISKITLRGLSIYNVKMFVHDKGSSIYTQGVLWGIQ